MEEYRPPKLVGKKAPLNCLVLPDQHYTAWKATQRYNMSFGEYVGALIDRAEGRPNKLDGMQRGGIASEKTSSPERRRKDAFINNTSPTELTGGRPSPALLPSTSS